MAPPEVTAELSLSTASQVDRAVMDGVVRRWLRGWVGKTGLEDTPSGELQIIQYAWGGRETCSGAMVMRGSWYPWLYPKGLEMGLSQGQ